MALKDGIRRFILNRVEGIKNDCYFMMGNRSALVFRIATIAVIIWVGSVGLSIRDKYQCYYDALNEKIDPEIYQQLLCNDTFAPLLNGTNFSALTFHTELAPDIQAYKDEFGRIPTPDDLYSGRYRIYSDIRKTKKAACG